jgi:hypothetical protein
MELAFFDCGIGKMRHPPSDELLNRCLAGWGEDHENRNRIAGRDMLKD